MDNYYVSALITIPITFLAGAQTRMLLRAPIDHASSSLVERENVKTYQMEMMM
jgi:hypothetical protein